MVFAQAIGKNKLNRAIQSGLSYESAVRKKAQEQIPFSAIGSIKTRHLSGLNKG